MDKKMNVLDVQLDDCSAKDAMKAVTGYLQTEPVNTVEIVTVDVLMLAAQTGGLKENIEELDLVLAGDEAILKAAEVAEKKKIQEAQNRVFIKMLMRYFHKNHYRIFLLTDSEEETDRMKAVLEENYSGIELVGAAAVPEGESADDLITNRVNGAEADCVLAALASPKQEEFIARCKNVLNTKLWLGIGKNTVLFQKERNLKEKLTDFVEKKILTREVRREKKKKES